jgi:hypothetical protein
VAAVNNIKNVKKVKNFHVKNAKLKIRTIIFLQRKNKNLSKKCVDIILSYYTKYLLILFKFTKKLYFTNTQTKWIGGGFQGAINLTELKNINNLPRLG